MPQIPGAFQQARTPASQGGLEPRVQPQTPAGVPMPPAVAFGINDGAARGAAQLERAAESFQQQAEQGIREETVTRRLRTQAEVSTGLAELRTRVEESTDPLEMNRLWQEGREALVQSFRSRGGRDGEWAGSYAQAQAAQEDRQVNALVRTRRNEGGRAQVGDNLLLFARAADAATTPEARAQAITQAQEAIEAGASAGFYGRDDAQRMRSRFAGQVQANFLNRLLDQNPAAAMAIINDPARTEHLTPEQTEVLRDRARSRQLQMVQQAAAAESRAEAAASRQERNARIAVSRENGFLAAGIIPDPARLASVSAAVRGTEMEAPWRGMIEAGRVTAEFAALPPARQAERIEEADTRRRSPNATELDLAQYDRLVHARSVQAQDYRAHPWERAVQDRLIPEIPALNMNDPASLNARIEAAQLIGAARGIAVPAFTTPELQQMTRQFAAGDEDARNRMLTTVRGIADPAIRNQTLVAFERARGDAGRLPPGSLMLVGDMQGSRELPVAAAGRRLMSLMSFDPGDRARQIGETRGLNDALLAVQGEGPQAVLGRAGTDLRRSGYGAMLDRDMEMIRRASIALMAQGETNPTRAVRTARDLVNASRAVINDESIAFAVVPRGEADPVRVTAGMRALRDTAVGEASARGVTDRLAAGAIRSARWYNVGDGGYALVGIGAEGLPVEIRRATLPELVAAVPAARSNAPRPVGQQRQGRMVPTDPLPAVQ